LLSGIGNMTLGFTTYSVISNTWLTCKLAVFVVAAGSGVFFGIRGARRTKLIATMASGSAPAGTEESLKAIDTMQKLFLVIQTILILIILMLSIVKPQW
jgi:hypothetical protein